MQLLSINLGKAEPVRGAREPYLSGIAKHPIGAVGAITLEGLADDAVCDSRYHGGPDQAIYLYGATDYAWWEAELGRPLAPGTFGENLTLSDWESATAAVGDRFHIGEVVLEATAPRVPCATLSRHMGDSTFLKKFRMAERPGVYCRVLREGAVRAGDDVRIEPYSGESVSMIELYRDAFSPTRDVSVIRRHLASPLALRNRADKEKLLAELEAAVDKPGS